MTQNTSPVVSSIAATPVLTAIPMIAFVLRPERAGVAETEVEEGSVEVEVEVREDVSTQVQPLALASQCPESNNV